MRRFLDVMAEVVAYYREPGFWYVFLAIVWVITALWLVFKAYQAGLFP